VPSALRRAAASLSLSVTGSSAAAEEGGGDRGGGNRRRGAGTAAAAAAPAGALKGRQYHQLDRDMMVWTADVLDCRATSDSCTHHRRN
jgi:hypothetical protein